MIKVIIGNFFTFFYTTIITYIPPIFSSSNSFIYGPSALIELQNGYDFSNAYLASTPTPYYFARFYAGVYISIFGYIFFQVTKKLSKAFNKDHIFYLCLCLWFYLVLPAIFSVKFRPFILSRG